MKMKAKGVSKGWTYQSNWFLVQVYAKHPL